MTVIVGILCSDGVVIGSDSALAVGRVGRYTIERHEGNVFKIEIIDDNIITAFTGAAGLAQRFNDQLAITIKELRRPYAQPRLPAGVGPVGTPVQLILFNKGFQIGKVPYDEIDPVEIGQIVFTPTFITCLRKFQISVELAHELTRPLGIRLCKFRIGPQLSSSRPYI